MSDTMADLWAEIPTWDLPNKKQECQQLDHDIWSLLNMKLEC
jgi:hypothetical protein